MRPGPQATLGAAPVAPPHLWVELFGLGGVRVGPTGQVQRLPPGLRELLGYLVIKRDRPHRRDALVHALWEDDRSDRARNRLSTALWRLRKVIEPDGIRPGTFLVCSATGEVQFVGGDRVRIDLAELEATRPLTSRRTSELTAGDVDGLEAATSNYTGELLEGMDATWLVVERERCLQIYLSGMAALFNWYASARDVDRAIAVGQRILDHDPLREEIHRALIRLYGECGLRASAVRQFTLCQDRLREDLGVGPLPETIAVAAWATGGAEAAHLPSLLSDVSTLASHLRQAQESLALAKDTMERVLDAVAGRTSTIGGDPVPPDGGPTAHRVST